MTRDDGVRAAVVAVPAEATFVLRQRVLRPHQRVEDMGLRGDDNPSTVYLATLAADDAVTGCVRLEQVSCPWRSIASEGRGRDSGWQLRAMAVDESRRGEGLGRALVAAAVAHAARHGGGFLWCNARTTAAAFYQRAGFSVDTAPWDDPQIGPHVGMSRRVGA